MEIQSQLQGAVTVLKPSGGLIATEAASFRERVGKVAQTTLGRLVIDASLIPFVDSIGLEALLDLGEQMTAAGRALKLCAVTPTVRQTLDLTGLADAFEFYPDVLGGVRSFL